MTPSPDVTAGHARAVARAWVEEHVASLDGFIGAYTVGSINALPDDAVVPRTSDVDVMVVLDRDEAPLKPGKMVMEGVLLEITMLSLEDVRELERVLGHYHLAPGVWSSHILADPYAHLARLRDGVRDGYERRHWVLRRCEMAREVVVGRLASINPAAPLHEQVMPLVFAAGGVPHILLVAGLKNPTVRRRFEAARELLHERGIPELYPELLALLGSEAMIPAGIAHHLDVLTELFDAASAAIQSPVPYASDLSRQARPLAIDGVQESIKRGDHREAMFWIAVTWTRCMHILHADAPELVEEWDGVYRELLADVGIGSEVEIGKRVESIRSSLLPVWSAAERLLPEST